MAGTTLLRLWRERVSNSYMKLNNYNARYLDPLEGQGPLIVDHTQTHHTRRESSGRVIYLFIYLFPV